ncbi:MAG: serine aminopeptidase domain-containing protein, partial [Pseudoxanthomonas sp.]
FRKGWHRMSLEQAAVRERVEWLGDERNLVAIVSEPPLPQPVPRILVLNAGVLHRVGPHRLHVRLARRLAAMGYVVARMDLSGIGDSRALPGRMTFRESSVADIRTALDTLAAGEPRAKFFLFGICSGADNALAAAEADARIAGLILVDPPAYASRQARLRHLARKAKGAGNAWSLPARAVRSALRRAGIGGHASPGHADGEAPVGGREMPPIDRYGSQLETLAARGVRILAIYSGVLGQRYNHEGQLFEWFPGLQGKIDCAYFPEANHTFTELSSQETLEALVLRWCRENSAAV